MQTLTRFSTALFALALTLAPAAAAQSASGNGGSGGEGSSDATDESVEEPLLNDLNATLQNEYFSLGALVQGVADFQPERRGGSNGFRLAKARLKAGGTLDGGWGYKLQTDFSRQIALLDAVVNYEPTDGFGGSAGLFKAPFSYEYLVSAPDVKFVGRPQVIGALVPRRHVGISAAVSPTPGVTLQGGIFNGNGRTAAFNDNNRFLYSGRFTAAPSEGLTLGASAAYNDRSNLYYEGSSDVISFYSDGLPDAVQGEAVGSKLLLGADAHLDRGPWLLGAEAIYGRIDQSGNGSGNGGNESSDRQPFGHYVTLGYDLPTSGARQQVLVRWDSFTGDVGEAPGSDLLIAGYNLWPTSVVQVQVNYVVPARDADTFDTHRLRADVQLSW
jgi:phosphate-selective porin